jgi:hypothetical protein
MSDEQRFRILLTPLTYIHVGHADRREPPWRAGIPSIRGHKWRFLSHNPKGWDYFCARLRCMKYIPVFHRYAAS